MKPPVSSEWLMLNRQILMGEVAILYHRLQRQAVYLQGQEQTGEFLADLPDLSRFTEQLTYPSTLQQLCQTFQLSDFEREILLLCAGAELSIGWGQLCGQAQGNPRLCTPTFELAQMIADAPYWGAFSAASPLRYWQMIEVGAGDALITAPLRIDERILRYLLALPGIDDCLAKRLKLATESIPNMPALVPSHQAICDRILNLWRQDTSLPVIHLWGQDLEAQVAIATCAFQSMGLTSYQLNLQQLPPTTDQQFLIERWQREAKLSPVALIINGDGMNDPGQGSTVKQWSEAINTGLILISQDPYKVTSRFSVSYEVKAPTRLEQYQLWQQAFSRASVPAESILRPVTNQFSLSAQQIQAAALQTLSEAPTPETLPALLWTTCRVHTRPRLDDLAQRLTPREGWDDLVLPPAPSDTLKEMVACLRSQRKVYDDWGFAQKQSRGLGISALFSGISGTGKTMAAGVIAQTLQLDLYRIDLSSVVSKYIGETEKNLRRVFDAAEAGSVVLLFDEADALFGKRSEVRDSHDRYANMEVSYLLQRMEAYQGLAILTTNLKESIDPAFMRRLRFIVKFPAPDFDQRLAIWQRIFPLQTPTQDLNYRKLAKLNVTGGLIRNIALTAAFIAADQDTPITMEHLLRATQSEYSKLERPVPAMEVKGWVE